VIVCYHSHGWVIADRTAYAGQRLKHRGNNAGEIRNARRPEPAAFF